MSATIYIYSEEGRIDFECDEDAVEVPTIWIRSRPNSIGAALNLSRDDRAKLRSALDRADAIADKA